MCEANSILGRTRVGVGGENMEGDSEPTLLVRNLLRKKNNALLPIIKGTRKRSTKQIKDRLYC